MDDMKICSKCKTISSKSNFNKDLSTRDGLNPFCKVCRLKYYNDKREQKLQYQKLYAKQNRLRINNYEKNKRKTDFNYKIAHNIRVKTNRAFKSLNNNMNILIGCSNSHLRKWIIFQLYGDMTLENYGNIWCLDHSIPLKKTNENNLYKYTNWINLRPMYIKDNISKGSKIDNRLYLLQEIKAKYFLKKNNDQEGLNEALHR